MRKLNALKNIIASTFLAFYLNSAFHFELVHVNKTDVEITHTHSINLQEINYFSSDTCVACLSVTQQNIDPTFPSLSNTYNSTQLFYPSINDSYSYLNNTTQRLRAPPQNPA